MSRLEDCARDACTMTRCFSTGKAFLFLAALLLAFGSGPGPVAAEPPGASPNGQETYGRSTDGDDDWPPEPGANSKLAGAACNPGLLEQHIRWCLDVEGNRKQRGIKRIKAGARDGRIKRLDRGFKQCQKGRKAARRAYFACPPALRIQITRSLTGLQSYDPQPVPPPK